MKQLVIILLVSASSLIYSQDSFYLHSNIGLNLAYPEAPHNKIWGLSYNIGFGIGYDIKEKFTVEILYQYNEHKLDAFTYNGQSIYYYINSILFKTGYTFLKSNSLRPYIDIGIGISQVKLGDRRSSTELSLFPGVGIKYSITHNIKLKMFFEYAFIGKKYLSGEYLKYFPLQIGVEYSL